MFAFNKQLLSLFSNPTMHKLICLFIFLYLAPACKAVDFKLGLMAGVNTSLNQLYTYNDITGSDPKLGYNAQAYARFKFSSYILQPELGYLTNRVGFSLNENGQSAECNFNLGQMYTSVLMGFQFSKIRFAIGPSIVFYANQSFDALTSKTTVISQVNEGRAQIGAVANLGINVSKRWSLDARVSRTFTQSEFNSTSPTSSYNFSGNTGLISIMLGYAIFKTK
jgi:hypothetical protein